MAISAIRTSVVKNLDELFWYIQPLTSDDSRLTIVTARSVVQRIGITGATSMERTVESVRGAGHSAAANKGYAVALTAIRDALQLTVTALFAFAAGDPPGTAVHSAADAAIDLGAEPTLTAGVDGDMVAIVEQPKAVTWATNGIPYVTAISQEPNELRRDIRDKDQLQHRKKMSLEGGVLTLTAKYENAKRGLSKYVDQDIIVIGERIDDRAGMVTEKCIFYGSRINAISAPSEAEGDSDSDVSIPIAYELLAIVGEKYTA